jgi:hypothetical protein
LNTEVARKFMGIVQQHSPKCFINTNFELIVEPRNNIYFRLEDVETELELKCKVLAWLSRPSCKGVSDYWQKRIRAIVNEFLGTDFSFDDMVEIYTYLGNDCNRNKSIKFIESDYDLSVLTAERK